MEKAETERKEKLSFHYVPTQPVRENSKKIAKKLGKLWKTITDSSQAKIGRKMLRKRENKNYHSVSFQKNSKKIQKIEKYHYGFNPNQNMLEKAEKVRK